MSSIDTIKFEVLHRIKNRLRHISYSNVVQDVFAIPLCPDQAIFAFLI